MANNYYDATGTLTLKKVTPVIKALFGNLELDPDYPGKVAESAEVLKVYSPTSPRARAPVGM